MENYPHSDSYFLIFKVKKIIFIYILLKNIKVYFFNIFTDHPASPLLKTAQNRLNPDCPPLPLFPTFTPCLNFSSS